MPNAAINMASPVNWGHPLNRDLRAWWMVLPGVTSGSRLDDLTNMGSSGNPGTLTSMAPDDWVGTTRPGSWGELDFDGVDDEVVIADNPRLHLTDDLTVSLWFRATTFAHETFSGILCKRSVFTTLDWELYYDRTASELQFIIGESAGDKLFDTQSVDPSLNEWHLAMVTKRGTLYELYLDGVLGAAETAATTWTDSDSIVIGSLQEGGLSPFRGRADDIRIWGRGLSAGEALQYYYLSRQGYTGVLNRVRRPLFVAAAAGLSIPVAMHNYYRQRQWAGA